MSIELFTAVLMGDSTLTAGLLSVGADPNLRKTALWSSVIEMVSEHPEFAPHLLRTEHSDPNPRVIWTWTPLLLACAQGHWNIAGILLDAGAEADVADEQAQTPLLFAIRGAQSGLVLQLLARSANPNATTADGITPLMTAAALDGDRQPHAFMDLRRAAPIDWSRSARTSGRLRRDPESALRAWRRFLDEGLLVSWKAWGFPSFPNAGICCSLSNMFTKQIIKKGKRGHLPEQSIWLCYGRPLRSSERAYRHASRRRVHRKSSVEFTGGSWLVLRVSHLQESVFTKETNVSGWRIFRCTG